LVLHIVPAQPDTKTQTAPAQYIDFCGLLRDECRLPLRKNHDACGQLKPGRYAGEKPEENHRFMKRVLMRVGAAEFGFAVGMRSQDVVINEKVIVAEFFRSLSIVFDSLRIIPEFNLWKNNAVFHVQSTF